MPRPNNGFHKNVFINCPFDSEYVSLLRPLLFTIIYLGYQPRIASENFDSGEQRISKICSLICDSKFSVHDISRIKSAKRGELYRLNMPFELGLDYGCRAFKNDKNAKQKRCLVLEKEQYQYKIALSDLSGIDIKKHGNEPEEIIRQTRNWFVENGLGKTASATTIWVEFNEFMADFYLQIEKEGYKDKDLQMMPVPEYITYIKEWLIEKNLLKTS